MIPKNRQDAGRRFPASCSESGLSIPGIDPEVQFDPGKSMLPPAGITGFSGDLRNPSGPLHNTSQVQEPALAALTIFTCKIKRK
jgi:hypothetical protein